MNEEFIYECTFIIPHTNEKIEPYEIKEDLPFLPIKGMQISINEDWDGLLIVLVDYCVQSFSFIVHIEQQAFDLNPT